MLRIFSISFGLVLFLFSGFFYLEYGYVGFPDGFVTEIDRYFRLFYLGNSLLCFFFGLAFLYFAIFFRRKNRGKILKSLFIAFALYVLFYFILAFYLDKNKKEEFGAVDTEFNWIKENTRLACKNCDSGNGDLDSNFRYHFRKIEAS